MKRLLDLTPYKCKRCGEKSMPKDSLADIWDVYKASELCPDCYDKTTIAEIAHKVNKFIT